MADGDEAGKGRGAAKAKHARRVKRKRSTAAGEIVEDVYSEPPPRPAAAAPKARSGNALDAYRDRMGKVSDDVIATEAGVSRAMVGGYRRRFNIPAYAGYKWQKGVGPPHRAKGSGRKAAAASGKAKVVVAAGRRRRKGKSTVLEGFLADLGKLPDDVIADRAGLSRGVVGRYRRERGIEAYDGYKFQDGHAPLGAPVVKRGPGRPKGSRNKARPARPPKTAAVGVVRRRGPRGKLEPFADLIGTVPDAEVAAMAGVSRPSVATWRHRRGIPPADRVGGVVAARVGGVVAARAGGAGRASAPTVGVPKRRGRPPGSKNKPKVGALAVTSGAGMRAYAVVAVRGQQRAEFVTVGSSVVDAANRVTAALSRRSGGTWVIEELRALGLAL